MSLSLEDVLRRHQSRDAAKQQCPDADMRWTGVRGRFGRSGDRCVPLHILVADSLANH